jgi:hypothetical protein
MARAFVQQTDYRSRESYRQGTIRRLITIGTPHLGSPLGPLVWNNRDQPVKIPTTNLTVPLEFILWLIKKPIGLCHRDFEYSATGMSLAYEHMEETPVASHALAGTWSPDGTWEHLLFSGVIRLVYKTDHDLLFEQQPNDLLVSLPSQLGHLGPVSSSVDVYPNTLHSKVPLKRIAIKTDLSSSAIQSRVIELFNSTDDQGFFHPSFPKPTTRRDDDFPSYPASVRTPVAGHAATGTVAIVSPTPGSVFKDLDTVRVVAEARDGATPTGIVLLVQELGIDTIASIQPYTDEFVIPADGPVGRLSIAIIAQDASGELLGDTTSITVASRQPLSRLDIEPGSLELDGQVNRAEILVLGVYGSGADTITRDLSDGASGTTYAMLHGASVAEVDEDGVVQAVGLGGDTVVVTHYGKVGYVPVVVTGMASSVEENTGAIGASKRSNELSVSPNPVTGIATVRHDLSEPGMVKLDVVDMLGRVVHTEKDGLQQRGPYTRMLDLSGLASGVYLCRLQSGEEIVSVVVRLVK